MLVKTTTRTAQYPSSLANKRSIHQIGVSTSASAVRSSGSGTGRARTRAMARGGNSEGVGPRSATTSVTPTDPARRPLLAAPARATAGDGSGSSGSGSGGNGDGDDSNKSSSGGSAVTLVLLAVGAAAVFFALRSTGFDVKAAVQNLEDLIARSGPAGPAIFVAAYAASAVALLPASLLTLGAGYLFGPLAGTALVSAGSTAGAAAAFLVSRTLARPLVAAQLGRYPRFSRVDAAVAREGARIVLLLRLSPLFPYNALNYLLGATSVEFWPYVAASWAGMLPGTFAYVFLGAAGRAAGDAAAGGGDGAGGAKWALYAVGAAATVLATRVVSQAAARALDESENGGGGAGDSGSGGAS